MSDEQDKTPSPYVAAVQAVAQEASERALESILLRMGIDPDDKDGLKEFRENLAFVARMKRGANQLSSVIIKTCAGAIVAAFLWMLVQGFRDWILLPR